MSELYELYNSIGNDLFSKEICEIAPYFSTINPRFESLRPGYCEVTMPNTRKVHNHLGTVHAIAMCNLAEIAAGIMTDISIPKEYRWIPVGMRVKYLAKARTDLKGIADGIDIDWSRRGEISIPVTIYDNKDTTVCQAFIEVRISRKKK